MASSHRGVDRPDEERLLVASSGSGAVDEEFADAVDGCGLQWRQDRCHTQSQPDGFVEQPLGGVYLRRGGQFMIVGLHVVRKSTHSDPHSQGREHPVVALGTSEDISPDGHRFRG